MTYSTLTSLRSQPSSQKKYGNSDGRLRLQNGWQESTKSTRPLGP
ncbi:hypothetical protein HDG37_007008 [Paraburkholderia sp. MM5384-R2]|nr:hypothetical protein [Paraburkholderia sp. MM5384-R2]